MTLSDKIRSLAKSGMSTADIAAELGIRYQHAYNVLRAAGLITPKTQSRTPTAAVVAAPQPRSAKPQLQATTLLQGGFAVIATWQAHEDEALTANGEIPRHPGVYAFVIAGQVMYVGVATNSLNQRLYAYTRPGPTQRTNIRLQALILQHLAAGDQVEILVAMPPDTEWNGLPVSGSVGLELGLIKRFNLPWNSRSAG